MSSNKQWNLLFIEDENSQFDSGSKLFSTLFNKVDIAHNNEEALKMIEANAYEIIINDITEEVVEGMIFLKDIKEKKNEQVLFAFVAPKDTDKLYGIADLGIHAFELSPEQLEPALEAISQMDLEELRAN